MIGAGSGGIGSRCEMAPAAETNGLVNKSVVLVSDVTWGGAAIACRRLFEALAARNDLRAQWIAAEGDARSGAHVASAWPPLVSLVIYRVIHRFFHQPLADEWRRRMNEAAVAACVRRMKPDIISLHNIHHNMTFGLLPRLPREVPIVWTLHDMWPLTGYCTHSLDCPDFDKGCTEVCPQAGQLGAASRNPAEEWRRRRRFYQRRPRSLAFVAPSQWMADLARQRLENFVRTEHIPNILPSRTFRSLPNRIAIREILGFGDEPVLLAVAEIFLPGIKGADLLAESVPLICSAHPRARVVAIGNWHGTLAAPRGLEVRPPVRDEALLNMYYNAADLLVVPSRVENLPNVILEALAAGLPAVAFPVNGCTELVIHGRTGFLAKEVSPMALAEAAGVFLALSEGEREKMREACRAFIAESFEPEKQAQKYLDLFDSASSRFQGLLSR